MFITKVYPTTPLSGRSKLVRPHLERDQPMESPAFIAFLRTHFQLLFSRGLHLTDSNLIAGLTLLSVSKIYISQSHPTL